MSQWLDYAVVWFVVFPLIGYLAGSIPFGLLIGKMRGVDIREHGSGNIGATNAGRVLGKQWGFLCFFLDVLKGFGPVFCTGLAARSMGEGVPGVMYQGSWLLVGMGCIFGHMFPLWLRFKGGKGVATGLGVVLGFFPYLTIAGLAAFAVWILVTGVSRYVSLGSIVAATAFPVFGVLINRFQLGSFAELRELWLLGVFAIALPILIVYSHRSNIKRLLTGTENKIGKKKD